MQNVARKLPTPLRTIVATFGPREYGDGAFDGVEFQRRVEAAFFEAGARADVQRLGSAIATLGVF